MAKRKSTNNDLQITTQKTKDRGTQTSLNTEGEHRCSRMVSSCCSSSGTRRVTLVANPLISNLFCKGQSSHGGNRKNFEVWLKLNQ